MQDHHLALSYQVEDLQDLLVGLDILEILENLNYLDELALKERREQVSVLAAKFLQVPLHRVLHFLARTEVLEKANYKCLELVSILRFNDWVVIVSDSLKNKQSVLSVLL